MLQSISRFGSHRIKCHICNNEGIVTCAATNPAPCLALQLCNNRHHQVRPTKHSIQHHQQQIRHASGTSYRQDLKQIQKRARGQAKVPEWRRQEAQWHQDWELTVGVEIHAELDTERKLFSSALTTSAAAAASKHVNSTTKPDEEIGDVVVERAPATEVQPNSTVALHDLAYPGAQPVFQVGAVVPAIRAALALQCTINRRSGFDRKHYFYADQPAGYQITQYYKPFAVDGRIVLGANDGIASRPGTDDDAAQVVSVGVERVQLEQDTAKSVVGGQSGQVTLLDFNRVSHPLIEIVSRPDLHSAKHAALYVRKVQEMLRAVGAVTAGMETGGLRADVNVSVRRRSEAEGGQQALGQRTEIKNLSSLRAIEDAIDAERRRQISVLEAGGTIRSETRGWTLGGSETTLLRSKEGEIDYRYMPDPDLPPLIISDELVQKLRNSMPLLPDGILDELQHRFGISNLAARTLHQVDDGARLEYLAQAVERLEQGIKDEAAKAALRKDACRFLMHDIPTLLTKHEVQWTPDLVPMERLMELVQLLASTRIHNHGAKSLISRIFNGEEQARFISVAELAANEGLLLSSEPSGAAAVDARGATNEHDETIITIAKQVFAAYPSQVNDVLVKGKTGRLQFLGAMIMRDLSKSGKAKATDPKHVFEVVEQTFWDEYGKPS